MPLSVWLTLAGSGLVIGFLSGLVGIGGGVLTVPLLYFVYGHPGWSGVDVAPELEAVVAHATSLLVIVPTALVGTWAYHRRGAVAWKAALPIAAASVAAALAASRAAPLLPQAALKEAFSVVLLVSGARLLRRADGAVREESETRPRDLRPGNLRGGSGLGTRRRNRRPSPADGGPAASRLLLASVGGVGVGLLSALLGVGGGIVAIPVLVHVMRLDLGKVAATSIGVILFTAAAGVLGYAMSDPGGAGLPAATVGYVNWGAALPIIAGSVAAVGIGALVNQRLRTPTLRALFAVLFLVLGVDLAVRNAAALLRLF